MMEFDNLGPIGQFRQKIAEGNHLQQLQREAEAQAMLATSIDRIKRTKPLTDQINDLMLTLPPALRDRPWTMAELVSRLNGRYNERPHAQHVGEALRRLGWQRRRLWGDGGEGRRVWMQSLDKRDL